MNGASHLIGGVTAGVLLGHHHPAELAIIAVASLLPDIDRPNSLLGRFIPVLPALLERSPGKRTLTHSLCLGGLLGWAVYASAGPPYAATFAVGFLSHIVLDLFTGRVALFWPLPARFGLSLGVPPVFIEAGALAAWGVWLALGGYRYFINLL
ncbi:metal-dependent hydrolase [Cohnella thermotolerans]|uniref:metal-dependent hydrolase n=1 Tax=Cohnella thermotolerans TaxID=329858 RepID=UPI000429F596|nr:metal-dependent hydrolase [Cohnella thermotolerans]